MGGQKLVKLADGWNWKNDDMEGGVCQKSGKIAAVVYGWSPIRTRLVSVFVSTYIIKIGIDNFLVQIHKYYINSITATGRYGLTIWMN